MVSLADLRARDIVPTWQEAVAVVQELLHTLATQGPADRLPDLDHIALIANGDVVALPGGTSTEHPVRHLAQLLRVLLDRSAAPPQLEELVVANLATPPQVATVDEFSRQLAFFERPGRRSDVEQLVARALSTDAQAQAEEELRRLKAKALEAAEAEDEVDGPELGSELNAPARPQSRQRLALAAVLIASVLGVAGWWWLDGTARGDAGRASRPRSDVAAAIDSPPPEDREPADASPAPPAADAGAAAQPNAEHAVRTGASTAPTPKPAPSLLERTKATFARAVEFAFGPSAHHREPPASPDAEPAVGADDAAVAPSPRAARAPERRPSRAAAPQSSAPAHAPLTPSPASEAPSQVSTVVTTPGAATDPPMSMATATAVSTVVYTAADDDVMPAMLLRPVLPATPPPDVPPSQIGTLELVVDEQGDVERVRLISPSNRYHERMLVAHAKTWKFRPAIRGGQPVKFRTVVRLTI